MKPVFPGFPKEGMAFLRDLKKNNTREWFQPRKGDFERFVHEPMLVLVEDVMRAMREFAPDHVNDPKKAVYRIYRDTRFSNDKTPYKTHIAAVFPRRGAGRHGGAGFYFGISPEGIDLGGGVYMPEPIELYNIRRRVAADPAAFRKLITAASVKRLYGEMTGEQLKRVPKGFQPDDPAADLVRYKQFLFFVRLDAKVALTADLYPTIVTHLKAIAPFCAFLNGAATERDTE